MELTAIDQGPGIVDDDLKGLRGAAVGLGYIATGADVFTYCSIGNIRLRKYGQDDVWLVAQDGIVGGNMPTPRAQRLKFAAGDVVIMTADTEFCRSVIQLKPYVFTFNQNQDLASPA